MKWVDSDFALYHHAANTNQEWVDPYQLVEKIVNLHVTDTDSIIVNDFFAGRTGKFLIIGANNGMDHSRALLENGWQGIYCEPDPFAVVELIKNTDQYKSQVNIINAAITDNNYGLQPFYLSLENSACSSLSSEWITAQVTSGGGSQRKVLTNSISFRSLIEYIGNDFDFISIDVEGHDIDLCESIDWGQFANLKMILLEAGPSVLKQLYAQGQFILTDRTPTNAVYIKKDFMLKDTK